MIEKSSVGFFEIEIVAVVGNRYITRAKEFVKLLDEHLVVLDVLLVTGIIWQRSDDNLTPVTPTVGEA